MAVRRLGRRPARRRPRPFHGGVAGIRRRAPRSLRGALRGRGETSVRNHTAGSTVRTSSAAPADRAAAFHVPTTPKTPSKPRLPGSRGRAKAECSKISRRDSRSTNCLRSSTGSWMSWFKVSVSVPVGQRAGMAAPRMRRANIGACSGDLSVETRGDRRG